MQQWIETTRMSYMIDCGKKLQIDPTKYLIYRDTIVMLIWLAFLV